MMCPGYYQGSLCKRLSLAARYFDISELRIIVGATQEALQTTTAACYLSITSVGGWVASGAAYHLP